MKHAYKQVAEPEQKRLSFVDLVTRYQDDWVYHVPMNHYRIGGEMMLREHMMEAHHMRQMEKGKQSRVEYVPPFDDVGIDLEYVYPPIPDRSMDWRATREDYDGAPDSRGHVGYGRTKYEAIVDLLEQEGS